MPADSFLKKLTQLEQVNFLVTNLIPRRLATLFMGWFSKIDNPVICKLSIGLWSLFSEELNLEEAKTDKFNSLHECFIRELKSGARTINSADDAAISPCDGIVGAFGTIQDGQLLQAKGQAYSLMDLLADPVLVERYRNGRYITLRLKSTMYHRFHSPCDCHLSRITYISGDTWNVNPIALKRVEKLYCKNERAVIDLELTDPNQHITLVPVAAILVAGIKLHCLPEVLDLRYRGPNFLHCDADYHKGDELGYFQHGSTIILFANEKFSIDPAICEGKIVRMGQRLLYIG